MIDVVGAARSGMSANLSRFDAAATSVANLNTPVSTGVAVYQPAHPLASGEGYVRYPDTDLGEQVGTMIGARRGFEASIITMDRALDAYRAVLQLVANRPAAPS